MIIRKQKTENNKPPRDKHSFIYLVLFLLRLHVHLFTLSGVFCSFCNPFCIFLPAFIDVFMFMPAPLHLSFHSATNSCVESFWTTLKILLKAALCSFSTIKWEFENVFRTCWLVTGKMAQTACTAGLFKEYITLVACPEPSRENMPVQSGLARVT